MLILNKNSFVGSLHFSDSGSYHHVSHHVPFVTQVADYEKEQVMISPCSEDFITAMEELVDYIVKSVSDLPRLETLLFQRGCFKIFSFS